MNAAAVESWWQSQVELARWTAGVGLVVGVGVSVLLAYAVWWLYRHERHGDLSPVLRRTLTAVRLMVLGLLGLIGLEPVLVRTLHRRVPATTIVLLDDSASMGVRDHYRRDEDRARLTAAGYDVPAPGLRRADLVERLLSRADSRWLRRLAANNNVRIFRFSETATEAALLAPTSAFADPAAVAPPAITLDALGPCTDLARAVRQAIQRLSGTPAAGVVLLSDGGFNSGEPAAAVGRYLQSLHIPLFAVGTGDAAEPVNLRVTEVTGPRSAFARDPFAITVQVAAEGVQDELVAVELLRRDDRPGASEPTLVGRQDVHLRADGAAAPLTFPCRVDQPGSVAFIARVAPLPYEAVESDNIRETIPPVQVLSAKMKLLLIAGSPSYEYRYLVRLLERDDTIDVSCWLQSADVRAVRDGDTPLDHLPMTREELFAYDVIILLDPDPQGLPPDWASLAAQAVDEFGAGLLFAADAKHTTLFFRDPRTRPIVEALPIVPDPDAELILNQLGPFQRTAWPPRIEPEAGGSPLLRQADDAAGSAALWSALEGVYWHYPVKREKPAATVLLRHSNPRMVGASGPHVLYATQFVGAGRTAFLAFNSTWRWMSAGPERFERFWVQAARYLMEGKLLNGGQRGSLLTERDHYTAGDTVVVTLRALDQRLEPLVADSLPLTVTRVGEPPRIIQLAPIPGRDGFFQGRFVADRTGRLDLSVSLPSSAGPPGEVQRQIVITQADRELRRPAMRRDLLQQLADASAGRYFDIDQADQIPDLIPNRSESTATRERPRPLWDNAYVFAVLIALLTFEWIGRRKANLL